MAKTVHFIYLIPTDASEDTARTALFEKAANDAQRFFSKATPDGKTFQLASPIVDVQASTQTAAWFKDNDLGLPTNTNFARNIWNDYESLTAATRSDADDIWVICVDATSTGSAEGVTSSVGGSFCSLSEPAFTGVCNLDAVNSPYRLSMNTLVHELGHAFGLSHNTDGDGNLMDTSTSSSDFPDATFNSADLTTLASSAYLDYAPYPIAVGLSSLTGISSIAT